MPTTHSSINWKNPRAIKRLFNSTLLLMKIDNSRKDHKNASTEDELILFAILCMQLSFEEAYNFLVENIGDISNADELIKFTKIEYYTEELDNTTIQKELGLSDDELIRLTKFMKALISTIDKNNPEYPSDSAIKQFVVLVLVSTITSTLGADEDKENLKPFSEIEIEKYVKT